MSIQTILLDWQILKTEITYSLNEVIAKTIKLIIALLILNRRASALI